MRTNELSNKEYHQHKAISSSDVKVVANKSLAHWKGQQNKETDAMQLGTAWHDLVLEGGNNIMRGPNVRKNTNVWKEAEAQAETLGKTLLKSDDFDTVKGMADSVEDHPRIAEILKHPGAVKEESIFVKCLDTDLELRCRPDLYIESEGILFDLKSTVDAAPNKGGFEKSFWNYAYNLQCAFYRYVLALEGILIKKVLFACTEKQPPYATCLFEISDDVLDYSHHKMMNVLHRIREAEERKAYGTGWPSVNTIHLPEWINQN
jgi:hypothetical protein